MSPFVRKYVRWLVLALLLVLTGSANLLCLSVDCSVRDSAALSALAFIAVPCASSNPCCNLPASLAADSISR